MLRLLIDENLNHRILRGLKLVVPELECVVAQDAGLKAVPDPQLLAACAQQALVLVTHDVNTVFGRRPRRHNRTRRDRWREKERNQVRHVLGWENITVGRQFTRRLSRKAHADFVCSFFACVVKRRAEKAAVCLSSSN